MVCHRNQDEFFDFFLGFVLIALVHSREKVKCQFSTRLKICSGSIKWGDSIQGHNHQIRMVLHANFAYPMGDIPCPPGLDVRGTLVQIEAIDSDLLLQCDDGERMREVMTSVRT